MIIKTFESIADKYKTKQAIKCVNGNTGITYGALNRFVNQLSRAMSSAYGTDEETAAQGTDALTGIGGSVALLSGHGINQVAAMLAALKAGLVYVPMDPGYPEERLRTMLAHSGARLLVTDNDHIDQAQHLAGTITVLDMDTVSEDLPDHNPGIDIADNADAYIMYTSGSTGKPKGVVQTRSGMHFFAARYIESLSITAEDRITFLSSFSHDGALQDIFSALLSGATLFPFNIKKDSSHTGAGNIGNWLTSEGITVYHSVPSVFRFVARTLAPGYRNSHLRLMVTGGEPLRSGDVDAAVRFFPEAAVAHMYGMTEASVNTMGFIDTEKGNEMITLGQPFDEVELVLLNDDGEEVDQLETGEIYVGSRHVARGYRQNPEATDGAFFPDDECGRLYRTGDLGFMDYDGSIRFMGRKDRQIKIRGYRIEPAEIENRLLERDTISEAAVIERYEETVSGEKGENFLCAFTVANGDPAPGSDELRDYLAQSLPDYMIPTRFISLDALPMTATGKTDGKALAEMEIGSTEAKQSLTPPADQLEKELATLWAGVLGKDERNIGRESNFFALGGHSLRATLLLTKIHKSLGVGIPLAGLFETPSLAGLARQIRAAVPGTHKPFAAITPVEERSFYPLTPAQKRLFFYQHLEPQGTGYNITQAYILEGELDRDRLTETFRALIQRHESLRTSFELVEGQPVQTVHHHVDFSIDPNFDGWTPFNASASVPVGNNFIRPFDLSQPPLLRVGLVREGDNSHQLLVDMHHIISDGTSQTILAKEFSVLYAGEILEPPAFDYKDYACFRNSKGEVERVKAQESFWLNVFQGEIPVLELPVDFPRPGVQSFAGDIINFSLDRELTDRLNRVAMGEGVTLFHLLSGLFNLLLSKLTGQEDIVVGSPEAGRHQVAPEPVIGMFVNTLAFRNFPNGEKTFRSFLEEVKRHTLAAFDNRDYPFETLVDRIDVRRDTGRNPLFDVMLVLQNMEITEGQMEGLSISPAPQERRTSRFDMTWVATEGKGELFFRIEYCTALFKADTIHRFAGFFKRLATMVTSDDHDGTPPLNLELRQMEIIADNERQQILYEFNGPTVDFPTDETIHSLFKQQALKTPTAPAIIEPVPSRPGSDVWTRFIASATSTPHLTYSALDQLSDHLAAHLSAQGILPGSIIAILAERSMELMVGLIAILKAGCIYLPMDPQYPSARIEYMWKDSNVAALLTTRSQGIALSDDPLVIYLEDDYDEPVPMDSIPASQAAYIIYTSGSTGNPKGVLVGHRGFVNMIGFHRREFEEGPGDRMSQVSSPGFDAMALEVWPCLTSGATLVIADDEPRLDPVQMKQWLLVHDITISFQSTAVAEQLLRETWPNQAALRALLTGGDRLTVYPEGPYQFKFYNLYGPTEDTVFTTCTEVTPDMNPHTTCAPHIGKPIDNHRVTIVDAHKNLQPIGITGELCISGEGVALGYINQPEQTAEQFSRDSSHPSYLSHQSHPSYYRTGDNARWLPDGNIEFLGRIDQQVQIRGYRIELGEIESRLQQSPLVESSVVLAINDATGTQSLCAFITPVAGKAVETTALREYLGKHLPAYMIPSYLVEMATMPLTPNGKIDKKALTGMSIDHPQGKNSYHPPRTKTEEILATVWREVLGATGIGIRDNFFQCGGDSIKAIQVSSRLKTHGLEMKVKDLFQYPVIEDLARQVTELRREIPQEPVQGDVPLTPIQKWFFNGDFSDRHHFNQAVMLYNINGFDEEGVRQIFGALIRHHDALRIVYTIDTINTTNTTNTTDTTATDNGIRQTNRGTDTKLSTDDTFFSLEVLDFSHKDPVSLRESVKQESRRIQSGLDLLSGPLVKLGLFKTAKGDHLLIVIHHLVVDGISWRILLEDIDAGFRQWNAGKPIVFPAKTDSFQYWAQQLTTYAAGPDLLRQAAYWQKVEETPVADIPRDHTIDGHLRVRGNCETVSVHLDETYTDTLFKKVNHAFGTEINDILLSALGWGLHDWAGSDRFLISLEGHGREEITGNADISRTVGWFTSQYPVILELPQPGDPAYTIKWIKESLRRIPDKGMGYGLLRWCTPVNKRDGIDLTREAQIAFNYLGQFGGEMAGTSDSKRKTGAERDRNGMGISPLERGDSISPNMRQFVPITIDGLSAGGRLSFKFTYNKYEYEKQTIQKLADAFNDRLKVLITFCRERETAEPTPSDLGCPYVSIDKLAEITRDIMEQIPDDSGIRYIYRLNPMQAGMLYHWLKNEDSAAYFEQSTFTLAGPVDETLLEKSFNALVERHDVLRTVFSFQHGNEPLQVVLKERQTEIYTEDISHLGNDEAAVYINNFRKKDRERGFDLSRDMLIRAALFQRTHDRNTDPQGAAGYLVWSFHHILMDGWCLGTIYNELTAIYRQLSTGTPAQLETPVPYIEYIRWLEKQDREAGLDYWRNYLAGYESPAGLPQLNDRSSSGAGGYEKSAYSFQVTKGLQEGLNRLAGKTRVTLNTVFQALWGLLLHYYNGADDAVFGAVVSGRPPEVTGVEGMVGLFINTVPVRVTAGPGDTLAQIIAATGKQAAAGKSFEYLPLADIQAGSPLRENLIDHIMVFENYPIQEKVQHRHDSQEPIINVQHVEIHEQTNYGLNIMVVPGRKLSITVDYDASVYPAWLIENAARHFQVLLKAAAEDANTEIRDIDMMSEEEREVLLETFNRTAVDYPADKTIHELLSAQAARTPEADAVTGPSCLAPGETVSFTYRQLDEFSTNAAYRLREQGLVAGAPCALMTDRFAETPVVLAAILKAGGAYLPIDPGYPRDRIRYILEDSSAKTLVTTRSIGQETGIADASVTRNSFTKNSLNVLYIEEELFESVNGMNSNGSHLSDRVTPDAVVYIIYTSGSTGRPKGVMVEHRNVVRLVMNANYYEFNEGDRLLLTSALEFDVSTFEIWGSLLNGLHLFIAPKEDIIDGSRLKEVIRRNRIDKVWLTSALFNQVSQEPGVFEGVDTVMAGGDVLSPPHINRVRQDYPGLTLINGYGPTENTTFSTTFVIDREYLDNIPIGGPIGNSTAYIVDQYNRPVPIGVSGELIVGGDGVARGYLNRPELTADRFFSHRFTQIFTDKKENNSVHQSHRSYKTGDLARWLPDGTIQFLGRMDFQVKIRGFRIELGEIENRLTDHTGISAAVVTAQAGTDGVNYLCAYIVPEPTADEVPEQEQLVTYLSQWLPDYMIPAVFMQIPEIPLTFNGKTDKGKLPDPVMVSTEDIIAPRNECEKALAGIWEEVLGLADSERRIGIDDDFFRLGGHSLRATMMAAQVHKRLGVKIPLAEILKQSTIRKLASYMAEAGGSGFTSIPVVESADYYAISHAQKRLWIMSRTDASSLTFNMTMAMVIDRSLNEEAFCQAFDGLVERHESLRTVFMEVDGEPKQKILSREAVGFKVRMIDLRSEPEAEKESTVRQYTETESATVFDLEKGPLMRATLIHTSDAEYVFLLTMHHIISDALSMKVVTGEVFTLYDAFCAGESDPLPGLNLQYKDYAAWHNSLLRGEGLERLESYWLEQMAQPLPVLVLPTDKPRPAVRSFRGDSLSLNMDADLLKRLKTLARTHDASLFMVLAAAFYVLLYRYTGQRDIILGMISAGRDHADLYDQVGFFINSLPLRTRFGERDSFTAILDKVKTSVLGAEEHQAYPFDLLVEKLELPHSPGRTPVFDVVIDMINDQSEPGTGTDGEEGETNGRIRPFKSAYKMSKFDLTLYLLENRDTLTVMLEFSRDLFETAGIARMADRYMRALERAVAVPGSMAMDFLSDEAPVFPPLEAGHREHRGHREKRVSSYHQERIWFIDEFEAGNLYEAAPVYHNIPVLLKIMGKGNLDTGLLERSIDRVVEGHEVLRTRIITENNKPVQVIMPVGEMVSRLKVADETAGDWDVVVETAVTESQRPFVVSEGPLFRARLYRVETDEMNDTGDWGYLLLLTFHHIIADRATMGLVSNEILRAYANFANGDAVELPRVPYQYGDFVDWQRGFSGDLTETLLFYWKWKLRGGLQALVIPTDRPRALIHTYTSGRKEFSFALPAQADPRLASFSHLVLLLSAFKLLLHRYSGQKEIVTGTSIRNRDVSGTGSIVGPLANLAVLRTFLSPDTTFMELMESVGTTVGEAERFGGMPFDQLVSLLNPSMDMSRTALFDVLFQYEDEGFRFPEINGFRVEDVETNLGWGKYDFNLLIRRCGERFSGVLVYNRDHHNADTIERMVGHFKLLVEGVSRDAGRKLHQYALLTGNEREQLLQSLPGWNNPQVDYPVGKTVHGVFEEQAAKYGDRIALVHEGIHLSYGFLNEQADRVADQLRRDYGLSNGALVGVLFKRSPAMIIGILAVLKAGGAYVPIDPAYPQERIDYILSDSNAALLLTDSQNSPPLSIKVLRVSKGGFSNTHGVTSPLAPGGPPEASETAYVIYTSGTTGRPKGCMVTHNNVLSMLKNRTQAFDFSEKDTWTMFHRFNFDFSVWEMYGALLYGGKLIMVPDEVTRDPGAYRSLLRNEGVTVLNQTPAAFYALSEIECGCDDFGLASIRWIIFGGDALHPGKLKNFREKYPCIKLINMFGITETTIHVTFKEITEKEIESDISNIGVPIPTLTAYVVDGHMNLQPIGIPGELCVGGEGVSRGYLNRPDLTAEKFIENLFVSPLISSPGGSRLYRSGDLVKRLSNGEMEYLGRIDHQVKIRGFRIELGEIESRIMGHESIKAAVVLAKRDRDGGSFLCAYLVGVDGMSTIPGTTEMREYLSGRLPDYMVPAYLVPLQRIPVTANGKVDRKALPEPDVTGMRKTYIAPRNQLESQIAGVWQEVLGIRQVGTMDNFFDLGGNSLKAVQLKSKLEAVLGCNVPVVALFEHVTIAAFAGYLKTKEVNQIDRTEEINKAKQSRARQRDKRKRR